MLPSRPFRWLPALLGLGALAGVGWTGLVWSPAQEAARVTQAKADQREGVALAQACLEFMRQRYGNTPVLSDICEGTQSAAGEVKVHSASGTPWWTPPPGL